MRTLARRPRAFMQKLKKKLREERRAATASSTCPVLSLAACACCVELGEGSNVGRVGRLLSPSAERRRNSGSRLPGFAGQLVII